MLNEIKELKELKTDTKNQVSKLREEQTDGSPRKKETARHNELNN